MHSTNPGLAGHKWSREDYKFLPGVPVDYEVLRVRQTALYKTGEAKKKKVHACERVLIM